MSDAIPTPIAQDEAPRGPTLSGFVVFASFAIVAGAIAYLATKKALPW